MSSTDASGPSLLLPGSAPEGKYEAEGNALLSVIDAAQQRGCRGCCTAEYRRDRVAVREAVRNDDRDALIRLARLYGLHAPVTVAKAGYPRSGSEDHPPLAPNAEGDR